VKDEVPMRPDGHTTQPIAPVLLELGADVDEAIENDFERWCEGHLADNLRLPGFVSARRLRRVGPVNTASPASLTLYQLEAPSALETPQYKGRTVSMPDHFSGQIRSQRSLYRELDADPGVRRQSIGPAVLRVAVDVEPAWRPRFIDWYVNVHVAAVLDAPGMLGVRRFENAALASGRPLDPNQHTYCTYYEMEDAGVLTRPETLAAASRGACPAELAPHRVVVNHVYEEIFRAASP